MKIFSLGYYSYNTDTKTGRTKILWKPKEGWITIIKKFLITICTSNQFMTYDEKILS